jgi:cardiolipin synthase
VTALLVVAQFLLLFSVFFWLDNYAKIYYEGSVILALVCMVFIINDDSNPAYKIAWTLPIILFPVAGMLLFLYFKYNFGTIAIKKVAMDIGNETRKFSFTDEKMKEEIASSEPELKRLSQYLEKYGAATYQNSSMQYFPLGDDAMDPILDELEKAEKFIFIEFFIFHQYGNQFRVPAIVFFFI